MALQTRQEGVGDKRIASIMQRIPPFGGNVGQGVVLLPQAMFILAKAPHPNAAKLWIDFILSEEGQQLMVKGEALMSGRSGFKSPLPEYAPAIDSLKLMKMDWKGLSTEQLKKVRERWTGIFNP